MPASIISDNVSKISENASIISENASIKSDTRIVRVLTKRSNSHNFKHRSFQSYMNSFQSLLERFPPNPAMISRQNHHRRHSPLRIIDDRGKRKTKEEISFLSTVTVTPPHLLDDSFTWRVMNPVNTERYGNTSIRNNMSHKVSALVHERAQQHHGQLREYETLHLLGHGTFGVVFKIKEQFSGVDKALKIICKETMLKDYDFRLELLQREVCVQRCLDHNHIVCLFDHWEDDMNFYLSLEYATFGDLESFRQKNCLSRNKRVSFIRQITSALEHMASHRIAHRDIKGENVLVYENDVVKLADFGWAIQLPDGNYQRSTLCGTPEFVPPEMIIGGKNYDARHVDQWSLGVFTWELMQGHGPFDFTIVEFGGHTTDCREGLRSRDTVFTAIKNFVELDITTANDPQVGDFCSKLIVRNPRRRMTSAQAHSHPFLGSRQRVTNEKVRCSGNKRLRLSS